METLGQDIRYGLRMLFKSPAFAVVAMITLTLGIGGNTAMFSVVDSVLLRPLPFPHPERLVWVNSKNARRPNMPDAMSYPDFFDWRAQNHVFESMASYRDHSFSLTGSGQPLHLDSEVVSADFFSVLGVTPVLGRGFRAEEEKPGHRVVVLSHELWRSQFGADPNILGRAITLDTHPYTVVGVAPPGFEFPIRFPAIRVWTTLGMDAEPIGGPPLTSQRGVHLLEVVGRLRPGTALPQANAEMSTIARRLAGQYPDSNADRTQVDIEPELQQMVGNVRPALFVLLGAVGFVLLIACANVANLLLAQAAKRHREIAVRSALGAPRWRIVRQLLTESALLSFAGAALGLGLATWILALIVRLQGDKIPRLATATLDGRIMLFTAGVAVLAALLFGFVPALHTVRPASLTVLNERGTAGGIRHNRLRAGLVVAETAIGLVLMVGAGLLLRSFSHLLNVDPHFNPQGIVTLQFDLPASRYDIHRQVRFYDELLAKLNTVPGVTSAVVAWPLPFSGVGAVIGFTIPGRTFPPGQRPIAHLAIASPGYFRTLEIAVVKGREFQAHDTESSPPVVIVNEAFARRFFPGQDPIGQHIQPGVGPGGQDQEPIREIVGVVADVKHSRLSEEFSPQYYLPYSQGLFGPPPTLAIRTDTDPLAMLGAVQNQIHALDRELPVYQVRTLKEMVSASTSNSRFDALLLGMFAGVALLLTAVGLYGVIAYSVAQRTHELGVRIALGATPTTLISMVLSRGVLLAGIGLVIGMILGSGLTRMLSSMLYEIRPLDWPTFVGGGVLLIVVSLLASYIPARRAAKVDPLVALRYE